jgi:hypothetical protein
MNKRANFTYKWLAICLLGTGLNLLPKISYGSSNSLQLGISKSYPQFYLEEHYEKGSHEIDLAYSFQKNPWRLETGTGHYSLRQKLDEPHCTPNCENLIPITYWQIGQSFLYQLKNFHPLQVELGFGYHYMTPIYQRLPPKKERSLPQELGGSIQLHLHYNVSENFHIYFKTVRWRGTKSQRFHGLTCTLGVSIPLSKP